MAIFIFWIIFSFLVAQMGASRNIGWWGAFLLSIILSPLLGLLFTAISDKKIEQVRQYKCKHCDYISEVNSVYCGRCMRDNDGYTVEENKSRFANPETIKRIREEKEAARKQQEYDNRSGLEEIGEWMGNQFVKIKVALTKKD